VPRARITAALFIVTLLSFPTAFIGVAQAQTGYPPGTTTTVPGGAGSGGGTVAIGATLNVEACGYRAGSTVNVSIDGQAATTTIAKATGCGRISIKPVSSTNAVVSGIDPAITCGANNAVFTGVSSAGASISQTVGFSINCAVSAGIVFTGANISKWLLAALVLLALGALILLAERRRSRTIA
jgi:hypothetical protein